MRVQGRLIEWNDDKGYGFIQPLSDQSANKKVFLHIKSFTRKGPRPVNGCLLEYAVALDSQGRISAQQVAYVKRGAASFVPASRNSSRQPAGSKAFTAHWRVWLVLIYMIFLLAMVMTSQLPGWILLWPAIIGAVTYIFYGLDKRAAKLGQWRVQENTLHVLSAMGGWCGALSAQQQLRHKTAKSAFQQVFWVTVSINWLLMGLLPLVNLKQFF